MKKFATLIGLGLILAAIGATPVRAECIPVEEGRKIIAKWDQDAKWTLFGPDTPEYALLQKYFAPMVPGDIAQYKVVVVTEVNSKPIPTVYVGFSVDGLCVDAKGGLLFRMGRANYLAIVGTDA